MAVDVLPAAVAAGTPPTALESFAFTPFLHTEYRFGLSPSRPVCKAYMQGHCPLGTRCPDKHQNPHAHAGGWNGMVCKHWLRGLCKRGEQCEFVHEYNLRKMPECNNYARYGACQNGDECLYAHVDPDSRRPVCGWYERGFCPLGPQCAHRHIKKAAICDFFVAGFCPDGRDCKKGAHPRWKENEDLRKPEVKVEKTKEQIEAEREQAAREMEERERREDEQHGGYQERGGRDGGRGQWRRNKRQRRQYGRR